jgi:hypothetical protein
MCHYGSQWAPCFNCTRALCAAYNLSTPCTQAVRHMLHQEHAAVLTVASAAPLATQFCSANMWRYVTTHNATTHHMLAAAVLACAGCTRLAWQVGHWLVSTCC